MDVLIIDDDEELGEMLAEYLDEQEFSITIVLRGDAGLQRALSGKWDAVILDVMLPGMNGLDVLTNIRKKSLVPIMMLTAKGDESDRILGLETGADDYLPKPFNPREFEARLRAMLRRQGWEYSPKPATDLECGPLSIQPGSRCVTINGEELELTSTEFTILLVLAENCGQLVSKKKLFEKALGRPLTAHDRSIDMHISHLRRKLIQRDPAIIIHTIRGSGYQLES